MTDEPIEGDEQIDESLVQELENIQKTNAQQQTSPSQPPASAIPQTQFAGFGLRFIAFIIDWIVLTILSSLLSYLDYSLHIFVSLNWFLSLLIPTIYFAGFHAWRGQTIGKMMMKIKVVTTNYQKISTQQAIIRAVGRIVSGIALGIGYLAMIWNKNKQTWHDQFAKTYVIKLK